MAETVYLCRKNGKFFRYDNVVEVSLTGATTAYAGVTGVDSTDIVTFAGATMSDGLQITFTQLTGGSNIAVNRVYFAVNSSGATCKLAETLGGTAISLGSNITAGYAIIQRDEVRVWSSEFRDIFTNTGDFYQDHVSAGVTYATQTTFTADVAVIPATFGTGQVGAVATTAQPTATDLRASVSDEINHQPLRQTFLSRTHWLFILESGSAPASLPAEWQTGDTIAMYPPNTV